MARIIGSSFRRPFIVQPRQESALERNLAQFASPQGVYLAAKGLSALGDVSLPWGSDAGGIDKTRMAAQARAKALQSVQEGTQKFREAREFRPIGPIGKDITTLAQREGKKWDMDPITFLDVPAGERDRLTPGEMEILRANKKTGKDKDKVREDIGTPTLGGSADPELLAPVGGLSDEDLLARAEGIKKRNEEFAGNSREYLSEWIKRGQDPDEAMLAIGQQKADIRDYNIRVAEEIERRLAAGQKESDRITSAPDSEFESGLDPIFRMSPEEQRAEIRRLAKEAKTEKDTARVRELTRMHQPDVSTFGDLFTSESDRRKEFEEEVEGLIPKIDPLFELRKLKLETDIEGSRAQTAASLAEVGRRGRKEDRAERDQARKDEKQAFDMILGTAKNEREEKKLRLEKRKVDAAVAKAAKKPDPHNFAKTMGREIERYAFHLGPVEARKIKGLYNKFVLGGNGRLSAGQARELATMMEEAVALRAQSDLTVSKAREVLGSIRGLVGAGQLGQLQRNTEDPNQNARNPNK